MSADRDRFARRLVELELERDDLLARLERADLLDGPLWPVQRRNVMRARLREVHTLIHLVGRMVAFEDRQPS